MAGEQFSLCWDNFHKNMSSGMHSLLETEDLVDVTLAVEGKYLKAHKMVLSVCSPYFRELFQMNPCKHPIVFMKDVSYIAMNDLLTFMYQGEVQVNQEHLTTFIKTAEALQIKGLTSDGNNEIQEDQPEEVIVTNKAPPPIGQDNNELQITKAIPTKARQTTANLPAKRQRISSPPRERPTTVAVKADAAQLQAPQTATDHLIQFKMEPFEADQSNQGQVDVYEDNPDDTFAEDGIEESQMEDTEYNNVMKGEEEPQAGTSGDGMGENQDVNKPVFEEVYAEDPFSEQHLFNSRINRGPRMTILDGKFFKYVENRSTLRSVVAICQKCLPQVVEIKGSLGSTTNFLSHLRRKHGEDAFEEYQRYLRYEKPRRRAQLFRGCRRSIN